VDGRPPSSIAKAPTNVKRKHPSACSTLLPAPTRAMEISKDDTEATKPESLDELLRSYYRKGGHMHRIASHG